MSETIPDSEFIDLADIDLHEDVPEFDVSPTQNVIEAGRQDDVEEETPPPAKKAPAKKAAKKAPAKKAAKKTARKAPAKKAAKKS